MAIYLENLEARYLVGVYFECRRTNTYPAPGPWGKQTAYCVELFNYLDGIVAETQNKNAEAARKAAQSK